MMFIFKIFFKIGYKYIKKFYIRVPCAFVLNVLTTALVITYLVTYEDWYITFINILMLFRIIRIFNALLKVHSLSFVF